LPSFSKDEQQQLLNNSISSGDIYSAIGAQKNIKKLSQVVKNLEKRTQELVQEKRQKMLKLAANKKRSLHYLSQSTVRRQSLSRYYSYYQNRRRFRNWSRHKQRNYDRQYQQQRVQVQASHFRQKALLEKNFLAQKTKLEHLYSAVLPGQLEQQLVTAKQKLTHAWTRTAFSALASKQIDFFVTPESKFPPIIAPKPKYTLAQKQQIWVQHQAKEKSLAGQNSRLAWLQTHGRTSYQRQVNQIQSYLNRYTYHGRVSKQNFERNLITAQQQIRQLQGQLSSLGRRYNYGRRLGRRDQRRYNYYRYQIQKQINSHKRSMSRNKQVLAQFRSLESAQNNLKNLDQSIQSQKKLVTRTTTEVISLKTKLYDDKAWFKNKLQNEYTKKITTIRANERNAINNINRNTYHYWRRWGRRHYRWAQERDRQAARVSASKQVLALSEYKKTLAEVSRADAEEKALFAQKKSARAAQVAFYTELQSKSAEASKSWNYVKNLEKASAQSVFFAAEKTKMQELVDLEKTKEKIQAELLKTSPYQQKIARLKQQMTQSSSYSFEEFLVRNPRALQSGARKDSFIRGRRNIGRSSGYWGQRHARYVRSIGASKMGYSAAVVATMKRLSELAHQERLRSYNGWQLYYREHPLQYEANQRARAKELAQLESAEAKRKKQLREQLAFVESATDVKKKNLAQNQSWLQQTAEQRSQNSYTDEIIGREIEIEMEVEPKELSAVELGEVLSAQRTDQNTSMDRELATNKPQAKTMSEIQSFDADKAASLVVGGMHYWDSASGQKRKDATYNNQAIKAGISKNNTVHYAGGSYAAQQASGGISTVTKPVLSGAALLAAVKDKLAEKRATEIAAQPKNSAPKPETSLQQRVRIALENKRLTQIVTGAKKNETIENVTNVKQTDAQVEKIAQDVVASEAEVAQMIKEKKQRLMGLGKPEMATSLDTLKNSALIKRSFDSVTNKVSVTVAGKLVEIDMSPQQSQMKGLSVWKYWENKIKSYIGVSARQVVLGTYGDGQTNTLGTLSEIGAALSGIDVPMDIRDLVQSLQKQKYLDATMYAVFLLPLIGALKLLTKTPAAQKVSLQLLQLTNKLESQLKINLKQNGEFVTTEGFKIKVSDAGSDQILTQSKIDVTRKVGDGIASGAKFSAQASVQKFFDKLDLAKRAEFIEDFASNPAALKQLDANPELLEIWRDDVRELDPQKLTDFKAQGLVNIRGQYIDTINDLSVEKDKLVTKGLSWEKIARTLFEKRNTIKANFQAKTPADLRKWIVKFEESRGSNTLNFDDLIKKYKTKDNTMEGVYKKIAEGASRPLGDKKTLSKSLSGAFGDSIKPVLLKYRML
jgi:hypothetical protein